jgi:hypothetical protein
MSDSSSSCMMFTSGVRLFLVRGYSGSMNRLST